jgi:hypothetical protein
MIEMLDADGDFRHEAAAGFRQAHTAMPSLEQQDAKVLLQRLDAGTHARLADAEPVGACASTASTIWPHIRQSFARAASLSETPEDDRYFIGCDAPMDRSV